MKKKNKIGIIKITTCNISSIEAAMKILSLNYVVSDEVKKLENCDSLILPGVGSFKTAMRQLKKKNLIKLINNFVKQNKKVIGICLGMQLFMTSSDEFGKTKGLDLIKGTVKKIPYFEKGINRFPVPNVGWRVVQTDKKDSLKNFLNNKKMYFVHSYYVKEKKKVNPLSRTNYGKLNFCSAIRYKNIYGFQFHPEKSGKDGLFIYKKLLK